MALTSPLYKELSVAKELWLAYMTLWCCFYCDNILFKVFAGSLLHYNWGNMLNKSSEPQQNAQGRKLCTPNADLPDLATSLSSLRNCQPFFRYCANSCVCIYTQAHIWNKTNTHRHTVLLYPLTFKWLQFCTSNSAFFLLDTTALFGCSNKSLSWVENRWVTPPGGLGDVYSWTGGNLCVH